MPMFLHKEFPFSAQEASTQDPVDVICATCGYPPTLCICQDSPCPVCLEPRESCSCPAACLPLEEFPDETCEVCKNNVLECVCRPCRVCGEIGNPICYKQHNLKYTRDQLLASIESQVEDLEEELQDLYLYLDDLRNMPEDYEVGEEDLYV